MLGLTSAVRIFVCTKPADMRRSFDGLAGMASELVGEDPLSGHLFLFRNRRRDRLKILYWDMDGLCIWYKRLEEGTFELPSDRVDAAKTKVSDQVEEKGSARWEIRADELAMLLGGIDLTSARRKKRYRRPAG